MHGSSVKRRAILAFVSASLKCSIPAAAIAQTGAAAQLYTSSRIADAQQCVSNNDGQDLPLNIFSSPDLKVQCLWPCGWSVVQNLDPEYGIRASFYNPNEPGVETVAVYASATEAKQTEDLGTSQSLGQELALIAPFGELLEHSNYSVNGVTYYLYRVMFGGSTAGKFGAVMECRCVAVANNVKYTLRTTTSRYRWLAYPEVPEILGKVTRSLRVA